jgi:uncharacterized caspase-like protein
MLWFSIVVVTIIGLCLSSTGFAKTYQWDDYTRPLKGQIKLSHPATVEVHLPAEVLKKYDQIPLAVSFTRTGVNQYSLLKVNNQPASSAYGIGYSFDSYGKFDTHVIAIDTKYLHQGRNYLVFENPAKLEAGYIKITALRFDLDRSQKGASSTAEKTDSSKSSNKIYVWKDYTRPFRTRIPEIRHLNPAVIHVELPGSLGDFEEIPLIIDTKLRHTEIFLARLFVNTDSVRQSYRFDVKAGKDGEIKILVKARDFKAGPNTISIKSDALGSHKMDIVGLRFDLPDRETQSAKASKSSTESIKTYRWEDYSRPFTTEIRLGSKEKVIEVNLPEALLRNNKQLTINISKHNGIGDAIWGGGSGRWLSLSINDQAKADHREYGRGQKISMNPVKINIDTKNLKPGFNKLRFKAEHRLPGSFLALQELRFELPDPQKSESLHANENPSSKGDTKVYQWEDYTQPFKKRIADIRSGSTVAIEVHLPEEIQKYEQIPIIFNTELKTQGLFGGTLKFNTKSTWHEYRYRSSGGPVKIMIDARKLKPGLNTLYINSRGGRYDIVELRFDLPDSVGSKHQVASQPAPKRKDASRKDESQPEKTQKAISTPVAAQEVTVQKEKSKGDSGQAKVPSQAPQEEKPSVAASGKAADHTIQVTGTRWALVVGVSEYQDSRIPSLRYAANDAKAFYDWLVSPTGGRYAPARVKLLTNKLATEKSIKDALFVWLGQAIEEDVVTLYFACHGSPQSPDAPENLFLLPHDVQYDSIATTAFPMWDIETALKRFIKAQRVIVITDACHAGGVGQAFDVARRGGRGMKSVPISSSLQNLSHIGDGICIITASDDDQFSQESKKWGGGHGVFTYFLLKGLTGNADYNKDSAVSLGEIIPFLSEQVRRETRNAQTPTVAGRFDPALTIGK